MAIRFACAPIDRALKPSPAPSAQNARRYKSQSDQNWPAVRLRGKDRTRPKPTHRLIRTGLRWPVAPPLKLTRRRHRRDWQNGLLPLQGQDCSDHFLTRQTPIWTLKIESEQRPGFDLWDCPVPAAARFRRMQNHPVQAYRSASFRNLHLAWGPV